MSRDFSPSLSFRFSVNFSAFLWIVISTLRNRKHGAQKKALEEQFSREWADGWETLEANVKQVEIEYHERQLKQTLHKLRFNYHPNISEYELFFQPSCLDQSWEHSSHCRNKSIFVSHKVRGKTLRELFPVLGLSVELVPLSLMSHTLVVQHSQLPRKELTSYRPPKARKHPFQCYGHDTFCSFLWAD